MKIDLFFHLVRAPERHANRLEVQRLQRPELDEVDVGTAGHNGVNGVLTQGKEKKTKKKQTDRPTKGLPTTDNRQQTQSRFYVS